MAEVQSCGVLPFRSSSSVVKDSRECVEVRPQGEAVQPEVFEPVQHRLSRWRCHCLPWLFPLSVLGTSSLRGKCFFTLYTLLCNHAHRTFFNQRWVFSFYIRRGWSEVHNTQYVGHISHLCFIYQSVDSLSHKLKVKLLTVQNHECHDLATFLRTFLATEVSCRTATTSSSAPVHCFLYPYSAVARAVFCRERPPEGEGKIDELVDGSAFVLCSICSLNVSTNASIILWCS